MITVKSILDAIKAQPFDSFLFKFFEQVPNEESFLGHYFIYRPTIVEPGTRTRQSRIDTIAEFVYEAHEALIVRAERDYFTQKKVVDLSFVHNLIDNNIESVVLGTKATLRELCEQRGFIRTRSPDTSKLSAGTFGNVRFYSDESRHPEHKVFNLDDIFAVAVSERQKMHVSDPAILTGIQEHNTKQFIARAYWTDNPRIFAPNQS
jgi:hypothetical protein